MKRIIALLLVATVLSAAFTTEPDATSAQTKPAQHHFRVGKLNNAWKVYSAGDTRVRVITAKRGDQVMWMPTGSDIYLNFPDETIFGTGQASAADGKSVALTVSASAKPGRYTYSIFCAKDKEFATGDSPPVIIIQ